MLFSPIRMDHLEIKNRLVFPPITTNYGTSDQYVTEKMIGFYEERSVGGAGLIVVEFAVIDPTAKHTDCALGIYDDSFMPGLIKLASAIKKGGAIPFLQIGHAGPKAPSAYNQGQQPLSASELPFRYSEPPRRLEVEEIERIVQLFIKSIGRARAAGFEGVELHCAHYYLLNSFLSPFMNNREDQYGGTLENRFRIVGEIIQGARQKYGTDYPIWVRINGDERDKGNSLEQTKEIARLAQESQASAIHVSAYTTDPPATDNIRVPGKSSPGKNYKAGCFAEYAEKIKGVVNLPVIAVGKINTPTVANRLLHEGQCDLVAVGRGFVREPMFGVKAQRGEPIKKCLACNDCVNSIGLGGEMICRRNKDLPAGTEKIPVVD